MADVIVIGAGLSGLAAAHRLHTRGTDVVVLERGPVVGGNVQTIQRKGWRYELGPNSFLGSADAMRRLADELKVPPVAARPAASKRYLFLDGKLQSLPSDPLAAIKSPLLPMSAKLRLLAEPLSQGRPNDNDSVRAFFEQHVGREATERFVDAFVSGIYGGDISTVGIAAAFPKIYAMAVEHGSLARAAIAMATAPKPAVPAVRGTYSFEGGLDALPKAIASALGDRLHLNVDSEIVREGDQWRAGEFSAPSLILAAQAYASSRLLAPVAPKLAGQLDRIAYNPLAGVHLLFAREDVPHPMDGFGFLIPHREKLQLLGCIWSSALFDVCSSYAAAMTCFIGGAHDRGAVDQSETGLLSRVTTDLRRTMGITAKPVDFAIVRHPQAIPNYGCEHLKLRAEIERLASDLPGLSLAGNYLHGVSMNDAVAQGERAADKVLS